MTRPLAPTSFLILGLFLLPSLLMLWRFEDIPQFGELHDDSLYYASAESLAARGSYTIASLPAEPAQTKFPPLYPLLLSAAWKLDPSFPHNLRSAAWISWLALPALLTALMLYYTRLGFSTKRVWLLLLLLAINPFLMLFSGRLVSEILFTALLIATLLLAERAAEHGATRVIAAMAGVVGGLAYLTRSAGIVLLASTVLFLWRRQRRGQALAFVAGMLPFVLGWTIWSRLNQFPTRDPDLVYYTNYISGYLNNISLSTLPLFIWKNLDGLLAGLGSLVIPQVFPIGFLKILAQVIAVAMISGMVRMFRKGQAVQYILFAAGSAVLLIVWHFPPNERLVLPLFPLAIAGLAVELQHFFTMMRAGLKHRDLNQRVVAGMMMAVVGIIFSGALALQIYVTQVFLPDSARAQRQANIPNRAAYAWIRVNTPADANFFAFFDPLLYLYTGRHAMSRPLPPALWYRDDREAVLAHYRDLVPYARTHNLSYVLVNSADFRQEMSDEDRAKLEQSIRTNPALQKVWEDETAAIYRVAQDGPLN